MLISNATLLLRAVIFAARPAGANGLLVVTSARVEGSTLTICGENFGSVPPHVTLAARRRLHKGDYLETPLVGGLARAAQPASCPRTGSPGRQEMAAAAAPSAASGSVRGRGRRC